CWRGPRASHRPPPASGSAGPRAGRLPTSESGCGGSRVSSRSTRPGPSRRASMRFSKWHALGNSYVVVQRDDAGPLDAERVRRICDVERGIGADGVLEVVATEGSSVDVVIWNPDGSTAEMS